MATTEDTDELLADPTVTNPDLNAFRTIPTTGAIIISTLFMVSLDLVSFVLPSVCYHDSHQTCYSPLSIVLYYHCGVWCILLLTDRYLRYQHFLSRTYGYLDFYRKTRNIRRIPLIVMSGGSVLLLLVLTLLYNYCGSSTPEKTSCPGLPLRRVNYVQMVVTVETAIVLVTNTIFLVWTVKFNRQHLPPDIHREDTMAAFLQSPNHTVDIGYRDETFLDEVLEKQADMIRYLKQHNAQLGRKVLDLTSQLEEGRGLQL